LESARRGEDFSARAHELGAAIAGVHRTLAEAMPTAEAESGSIDAVVSAMRARCRAAEREVPELAQYRSAIESGLDAARRVPWPRLQRIHGDFHLGQVLDAPGRGWIVIDFEGEPLVPLSERGRLDTVMRDIAGMLRSFSYVGGTLASARTRPQADITDWVARCRASFLDGYASVSDLNPREHDALLAAFELDKAVYEARYEARNRPSWLPIPVAAIRRLTGSGAGRLQP
jgi:maltokinase